MHFLSPIVSQFILEKFLANHYGLQKRTRYGLTLKVLSVLFGLTGIVFLIVAANQWFIDTYGPTEGNAFTGLVMLAIAATILIGVALAAKPKAAAEHHGEEKLVHAITEMVEEFGRDIEGPILDNPKMAMALAAILGLVAGRKL